MTTTEQKENSKPVKSLKAFNPRTHSFKLSYLL